MTRITLHQPGSTPLEQPETLPNPVVRPRRERETPPPRPAKPRREKESEPVDIGSVRNSARAHMRPSLWFIKKAAPEGRPFRWVFTPTSLSGEYTVR